MPAPEKRRELPLAPLIGGWKCSGRADDKEKTFWSERAEWAWKFKGDDAWLTVAFEKGKHFTAGELKYDAKAKQFTLTLTTTAADLAKFFVVDSFPDLPAGKVELKLDLIFADMGW